MPIAEWVSGNQYFRPNGGNKGDIVNGHRHHFDHSTFFISGATRATTQVPTGAARTAAERWGIAEEEWRIWDRAMLLLPASEREMLAKMQQWAADAKARAAEQDDAHRRAFEAGDYEERIVIKEPGDHLLIRRLSTHAFLFLADHSLFVCCYSHITPQGRISQEYDGWGQAYG